MPEDPIECCDFLPEAHELILKDASKFYTTAREWTLKYAMNFSENDSTQT